MTRPTELTFLLMTEMNLSRNKKHNIVGVHSIKFLLVPMPAHKHPTFRPIVGVFIKTSLHADAVLNP